MRAPITIGEPLGKLYIRGSTVQTLASLIAERIQAERATLYGLFQNANGDMTRQPGSNTATAEDFGMAYWFDRTLPDAKRAQLAERLAYWCDETKDQHDGMPVPYTITYSTGSVVSFNNSQHALWGAKLFVEHYVHTGEQVWLDRAVEICDWVIANMLTGTSPNRRFFRLTNQNAISIKTISSADTLLRIDALIGKPEYATVFAENLAWVQANMLESTTRFFTDADSNTLATTTETQQHTNLEMIDGLTDAYNWTGDASYLTLAGDMLNTWSSVTPPGGMTRFQQAFSTIRLAKPYDAEGWYQLGLSIRNGDGGFPPHSAPGASNVFAHTYLMGYLHYSDNPEMILTHP